MSQQQEFEQFIYGKFVGPESGSCIVAHSKNLDNEQDLLDIAEKTHYFWGGQNTDPNSRAVGICWNNTPVLPDKDNKKIILIQASPAIDRNNNYVVSGSRTFIQHRYIFVPEATIATKFNNRTCWLLGKLNDLPIPIFDKVNQYFNDKNSWLVGSEIFGSLSDDENTDQKAEVTIKDTWKFLKESDRDLLLQALAVVANGKKLLLTNERLPQPPLKLLDNLLLFLPTDLRTQLSIAIGSIDPHHCPWAKIIVKLNNDARIRLSNDMIWLDFSRQEFIDNQKVDLTHTLKHQYIEYFIDPLKNEGEEKLIALCRYLDCRTNVGLEFDVNSQDQYLKFIHPSVDFILKYPKDDRYKINLLSQYVSRMESDLKSFLENLENMDEDSRNYTLEELNTLDIIWQALADKLDAHMQLVVVLLQKIYIFSREYFLKIVGENQFVESLSNLLVEKDFLDLIADIVANKEEDLGILEELQQACFKCIERQQADNYQRLKNLISHCENIFYSQDNDKQFSLWTLPLGKEITKENFRDLFTEKLVPLISKINIDTLSESPLQQYLADNFPDVDVYLSISTFLSTRDLLVIPDIAKSLEIDNSATNKLFISFMESELPKHHKPEFSKILIDLIKPNYDCWLSWNQISEMLYDNQMQRTFFLDKYVAEKCHVQMLKSWLKLLENNPDEKSKEKFLNSEAWRGLSLNKEKGTLGSLREDLKGTYQTYVRKFIEWANEKNCFELISGELIEYTIEIWTKQKSIDENIWHLLGSERVLSKLSSKDRLKLVIVHSYLGSELPRISLMDGENKSLDPEESQLLTRIVQERIVQFDDADNIDSLLHTCQASGLNILAILSQANHKSCNVDVMLKYMRSANKDSKEYGDCLDKLSKINCDTPDERYTIKKLMCNEIEYIADHLSEFQKRRLSIASHYLRSE